MGFTEPLPCRVFYPSKTEFSQPFCDFVRRIFRENEDIAMFKVVPPLEWKPRVTPFPSLDSIVISCPIRQHVPLPSWYDVPDVRFRPLVSKAPIAVTLSNIKCDVSLIGMRDMTRDSRRCLHRNFEMSLSKRTVMWHPKVGCFSGLWCLAMSSAVCRSARF